MAAPESETSMSNIEQFLPRTERAPFSPQEAIDLLDRIDALESEYRARSGRSAQDDSHLRYTIESVIENSDFVQEHEDFDNLDLDGMYRDAFVTMLLKGEEVAHLGDDDHWQEANYYQHIADVEDALERVGKYPKTEGEEN